MTQDGPHYRQTLYIIPSEYHTPNKQQVYHTKVATIKPIRDGPPQSYERMTTHITQLFRYTKLCDMSIYEGSLLTISSFLTMVHHSIPLSLSMECLMSLKCTYLSARDLKGIHLIIRVAFSNLDRI